MAEIIKVIEKESINKEGKTEHNYIIEYENPHKFFQNGRHYPEERLPMTALRFIMSDDVTATVTWRGMRFGKKETEYTRK